MLKVGEFVLGVLVVWLWMAIAIFALVALGGCARAVDQPQCQTGCTLTKTWGVV